MHCIESAPRRLSLLPYCSWHGDAEEQTEELKQKPLNVLKPDRKVWSTVKERKKVRVSVSAWLTPPSRPSPQGSPSSKRRGPLLQPIIEGETALFFDDIKVKSHCCCLIISELAPSSSPAKPPPLLPLYIYYHLPSNEPDCCLLIGQL